MNGDKELLDSFDYIKAEIMMKMKIWEVLGKSKNEFDSIYPAVTCDKTFRDSEIVMTLKDRQRDFHCLECFQRAKHCSHNDIGSAFRAAIRTLRKKVDLEKSNKAAILRQKEEERKRNQKWEEKLKARRHEAMR